MEYKKFSTWDNQLETDIIDIIIINNNNYNVNNISSILT